MIERIEAWLRVRDAERWKKDLHEAGEAVDEVGSAADRTSRDTDRLGDTLEDVAVGGVASMAQEVGNLGDALGGVGGQLSLFGDDVGRSSDMLGNFEKAAGTAAEGVSKLEFNTDKSVVGFGRFFGMIGPIALAVGAWLLPVLIGLGGALVAVAGSAGAAALGLGLVAVAAGGALVVGLGGVVALLVSAANGFSKVSTALDSYNLAVAQYGRNSDEAIAAQEKLNAVVSQFGGPKMLEAVRAWRDLVESFKDVTAPAMEVLAGMFLSTLDALDDLMPVIGQVTNSVALALEGPWNALLAALTAPETQAAFLALGTAFGDMAGPILEGGTSLLLGLLNAAVGASPYVTDIAEGFAGIAQDFAEWTASPDFESFLVTVMDHLDSWWELLTAIGGLFVTVLGGGAESGQDLVDSLTATVREWTAFLNTPEGQEAMREFFDDAVEMTGNLAALLADLSDIMFTLGESGIPGITSAFDGASKAAGVFQDVLHFFPGLFSQITQGPVEGFKATINAVWDELPPRVRARMGEMWSDIKGFFSQPIDFGAIFDGLWNAFRGAINKIITAWNSLSFSISTPKEFLGINLPGSARVTIGTPNIPHLATGGMITAPGLAFVGAQDDELAWLGRGSVVSPMRAASVQRFPAAARPISPDFGTRDGARPIVLAKVFLKGREIAEAIAEDVDDQLARA